MKSKILVFIIAFLLGLSIRYLFDVLSQYELKTSNSSIPSKYYIATFEDGYVREEGFLRDSLPVKYKIWYYRYPEERIMSIYIYPDSSLSQKLFGREFYRLNFDTAGYMYKLEYWLHGDIRNQALFEKSFRKDYLE